MTPIYCPDTRTALKVVNALECLGVETKMEDDHFVVTESLDHD